MTLIAELERRNVIRMAHRIEHGAADVRCARVAAAQRRDNVIRKAVMPAA